MLRCHHPRTMLVALAAWLWLGAVPSLAQTSVDAFRQILREQATFTADDLAGLEEGRVVARLLPVKDKREVAVCGIVRLQVPREVFQQFTRDNIAQQNNRAILQIGKFSNPPTIGDLQTLTLEDRDIEDLKACTVGDCKLKMSAAMINRVQNEVNWNAPDYGVQATLVFRQLLLDYVRDYLARGPDALVEYNDRGRGVRVDEELQALLEASVYFNQFAPEFTKYLRIFPRPELAGAENSIFWSKLKFGLKPVITITHVVIYARPANTAPQVVVASQQIYANHYFDSSLALSAFIDIPRGGTTRDSYLLYTNRSRADALGGLFGGLKRSLVESEAMGSLQAILQEQKLKLEASWGQPGSSSRSSTDATGFAAGRWSKWRLGGLHLFWWLCAIILIVMVVCLISRTSKRQGSRTG